MFVYDPNIYLLDNPTDISFEVYVVLQTRYIL